MKEYDGGFKEWCKKFKVIWNNLQKDEQFKYQTLEDCMRCHFVQFVYELEENNPFSPSPFNNPEEAAITANDMLHTLLLHYRAMQKENQNRKE